MYVDLSNLPDAPKEYQIYIKNLSGGLNTSKAPSDILDNQCQDMLNMLWKDGVLRSRQGTEDIIPTNEWSSNGLTPTTMFDRVWHNRLFLMFDEHEDVTIAAYHIINGTMENLYSEELTAISKGGSFFLFGEKLYFKGRNLYLSITYDAGTDSVTATPVEPYRPVVQINTNRNGVGDLYQPENRICDEKEIWFNADSGSTVIELPCDGNTKIFDTGYGILQNFSSLFTPDDVLISVDELYVGAALYKQVETLSASGQYKVDIKNGIIILFDAPPIGTKITARVTMTARRYRLPSNLKRVDFISVSVNGVVYQRASKPSTIGIGEYWVLTQGGERIAPEIIFSENLGTWNDANGNANRIKVVYRLKNADAKKAIDDCYVACTYGATGIEQNCVVFAGSEKQPNAFFWSGNDANGANPAYFPMEQYNLVGEYDDPVVAFGRQQNKLVIFQQRRISSAEYAFAAVDGRMRVSLNTKTINDKVGCIAPRSVQCIENNLVWLSENGVMYLKDSNYAYETLVVCISGNVNSLLKELRPRRNGKFPVSSFDDGERYWLFLRDGSAVVWDYSIRGYTADTEKLAWFPMSGCYGIAWAISDDGEVYGLRPDNDDGQFLFRFTDALTDSGKVICKRVTLKTQVFGTYAYLKNVDKMTVSMPTDQLSSAEIAYLTDYGERADLTPIDNLFEVSAGTEGFPSAVRVRRPKCKHVHQFSVRFSNDTENDMALASIQIFYTYRGALKAGRRM